jgi:uncharacterized protein YbjT (DUF2867 family)
MRRINGDANVAAVKAASAKGVPRFVYVSAVENTLPSFVLGGYFEGKRQAEEAVLATYASSGFVLRPSFIYGSRAVGGSSAVPLHLIGRPLQFVLDLPGFNRLQHLPGMKAVLAPPVDVEDVGAVAAAAALGELPSETESVLTVADIRRLAR